MATCSSILALETPWTEEPGELYGSWDHKRVRHNLLTKQQQQIMYIPFFNLLFKNYICEIHPLI